MKIGRALFLKMRLAYINSMAGETEREVIDACNIGDEGQVRLLRLTPVVLNDGTCNRDIATLLQELPTGLLEFEIRRRQ